MSHRERIDPAIENSVLTRGARRCCLCFCLDQDFSEKDGQIAHLDQDAKNGSEDNLAFLCLTHHSLCDSRTSQHKNYTLQEVKTPRARLHEKVESYKPCEWVLVIDGPFSEFDKARWRPSPNTSGASLALSSSSHK